MDNQAFRKDLEEQIARLNMERDDALITVGKKLGAIEYCQSLLNAMDEQEGAGNTAPIVLEGEKIFVSTPQQIDSGASELAEEQDTGN